MLFDVVLAVFRLIAVVLVLLLSIQHITISPTSPVVVELVHVCICMYFFNLYALV